jgi:DNA-binding response OmpR family regulator
MDGYEASRLLRQPSTKVRNHQIPIVAMTAHGLEDDRRKCLDAGMSDYISKPIRREVLEQTLDRWLASRCSSPQVEKDSTPPAGGAEVKPETVFDRDDLLSRVMGNAPLAQRLIGRVLLDLPQQLLNLSQAVGRADCKAACMVAHSIKGAAANVGGLQLQNVARRMEALGQTASPEEFTKLLPGLTKEWERFRVETTKFLDTATSLPQPGRRTGSR